MIREGNARRCYLGNLTRDNFFSCFFGRLWILSLIANRHFVPLFHKLGEIAIHRMMREASQGRLIPSIITIGQGNAKLFGDEFCVFVKRLIKIPHPKQ